MLTLEAAQYQRVSGVPEAARRSGTQAALWLGALLGEQIDRTTRCFERSEVTFNVCVSTMMDMPFTTGWLDWRAVRAAARRHTCFAPENFTPAYECAGWGFMLAYARRRCAPGSVAIISVVDINLLDLSFWRENEAWGKSGFGVATIAIRMPAAGALRLETGLSRSAWPMGEFCVRLREWLDQSSSRLANTPFLPAGMDSIYPRFLDTRRLMPNLHAEYGHAFGSDTWIAFIAALGQGARDENDVFTATSASLRGCWAMADLRIARDATLAFAHEAEAAKCEVRA
ncbi:MULTISPECIES: hypothetical protein [unclassified Paraburkholderia]|uniref:hypothetical protein n=1 Tax=unclassified Paraburkholderia TaxID=2615204 RepID=UPI002AB05EBC|nr:MULTISPECIES: hypothetical protein [unclassified Paraburkholderia]